MHQQTHADLGFVDVEAEPFQKSVVVVEAGVDAPDSAEDAAGAIFAGITKARPGVAREVIAAAAAETVVEARATEIVGILDIA